MNIAKLLVKQEKNIVESDDRKVKDLSIGEFGWVTPWSIDFSRLDIDTVATIHSTRFGTADVCIQRLSDRWYSVDMSESDECITMRNDPTHFGFGKIFRDK